MGEEVGVVDGGVNGVATGVAVGELPQPKEVAADSRTENATMEMNALLAGRQAESAECLNLMMPSAPAPVFGLCGNLTNDHWTLVIVLSASAVTPTMGAVARTIAV